MSGHYKEALKWIKASHGWASQGMAKMVLSLYHPDYEYAFRECIKDLSKEQRELCVNMCLDYSQNGETPELLSVGKEIEEGYLHLSRECKAMRQARFQWQREYEAKLSEEREENRADERMLEEHDKLRGIDR